MQTKPSFWMADALGMAYTRDVFSLFKHQNPHRAPSFPCSSRAEVSGFYVNFRLWLDFCLACTRSQQQTKLVQGNHTNRPSEVFDNIHVHKGRGEVGSINLSLHISLE